MKNKMQRIKNYNQIMLAIAGTVGVIILIFSAIMLLMQLTRSWSYDNNRDNSGVIATEETNELKKDSIRKQIISFNSIEVIDSVSQLFLLPVGQANLANKEKFDTQLFNAKNSIGDYSYRNYYYNNLVIFDAISSESKIIFEERLSIERYFIHEINNEKYIVIEGAKTDTNKDGILNSNDFQDIFIYDMQKKQLSEIKTQDNFTTLSVIRPQRSNQLVAQFGIDRNNNFNFEGKTEPKAYYKIDLNSMTLQEFINADQVTALQKLLEGR